MPTVPSHCPPVNDTAVPEPGLLTPPRLDPARSTSPAGKCAPSDISTSESLQEHEAQQGQPKNVRKRFDPLRILLSIAHFTVLIYFVIVTELMLSRNHVEGTSAAHWGIAQVRVE